MTVSTEYFDYVFNNRDVATSKVREARGKLTYLEGRLERRQSILERRPERERAQRLAARFERLVEKQEERVADLQARAEELNGVVLPQDSATFTFWKDGDTITGLKVTITDSPYDDTYVGGEDFIFTTYGADRFRGFNTRVTFIGEDFADGTKTFGMAGDIWARKLDGSYSDVTAFIAQGDNANFVTTVFADGVAQL